ncbi:MAG: sensor histidine kinase [Burkholderiaceae bacterium]
MVAALGIAYFTSRTIARPITGLADAARDLSEGDLTARAQVSASGEVRVLVDSFNSMAANLEQSMLDLSAQTLVIDKAPFGILVLDPDPAQPVIRYINEAFSRLLGYPSSLVLGRLPAMLIAPDAGEAKLEAVQHAFSELSSTEVELRCKPLEGDSRLMNWLVFPCISGSGEVISIVVFITDVTEIRAMETERERLAAELQESNKLEFLALTIAGISHDLNTPIGVGVTAASQLQRTVQRMRALIEEEPGNVEGLKNWCAKVEQTSEIIGRNLEKAGQLVQGFKKTSANATRTEWVSLNMRSLLDSLLVSLSPIMRRARCTVHLSCPPAMQLFTEPGSVSQALTNLLINATVHAFDHRENRQIEITVSDRGDEVLISVADNANGMSEEAAVKAFTPYFTTRRASGGSGLGLFSSRRVVEEVLGGHMTFETSPGRGTVFYIRLPKKRMGSVTETQAA